MRFLNNLGVSFKRSRAQPVFFIIYVLAGEILFRTPFFRQEKNMSHIFALENQRPNQRADEGRTDTYLKWKTTGPAKSRTNHVPHSLGSNTKSSVDYFLGQLQDQTWRWS